MTSVGLPGLWEAEHLRKLWHWKALCLIVPMYAECYGREDPWCLAFVPVDQALISQLDQMGKLVDASGQTGWVTKRLDGVCLLHSDGRWVICSFDPAFSVEVGDLGLLCFSVEGRSYDGVHRCLAAVIGHIDEFRWAVPASESIDDAMMPSGRDWELVRGYGHDVERDCSDFDRPIWFRRCMPGGVWPHLEPWQLPEPVGSLRRVSSGQPVDTEQLDPGVLNMRAEHHLHQYVFKPGQWPNSLKEHLTRPGPQGWAHFPEATVSFFHPVGETLVPLGERPEPIAEAPTRDMPAEVRLRGDAIEVLFGPLPTLLRGKAFRALQYELEEVGAMEPVQLRGSLSMAACNQVLEGRYVEHGEIGASNRQGMWFIRLGPRDDSGWAAPGDSLPGRMRQWYDGQS